MTERHPVFVYGTLRPGQGNYRRLLAGRTVRETPATAAGLALYGSAIPYAVPNQGGQIVGDLVTIDPTRYREVLTDLDALEGYHPRRPATSHYLRTQRSVRSLRLSPGGGTSETLHTAWIYLAGPGISADGMPRIPGDDWFLSNAASRRSTDQ